MTIFSGIDEAGLGPKVGSLFVSGVDVEGEIWGLKESKEIFRRNLKGYREGESLIISVFESMGFNFSNAKDIFDRFFGYGEDFLECVKIPAFGGEIRKLEFLVHSVVLRRIEAEKLKKNRFEGDAKAICEIALQLKGKTVICGLAGGYKKYERFLPHWKRKENLTFIRNDRTIKFVKSADKKFKEVALASLFSKYLREIEILGINRVLGFNEKIPRFSGYPADKNLKGFISLLRKHKLDKFIR